MSDEFVVEFFLRKAMEFRAKMEKYPKGGLRDRYEELPTDVEKSAFKDGIWVALLAEEAGVSLRKCLKVLEASDSFNEVCMQIHERLGKPNLTEDWKPKY